MTFQQISLRGKEYLKSAQTLLRAAQTMTDRAIAGQLKALADEEHRSMNATIIVAVERYVEDQDRRGRVRELAREVAQRDAELLDRLAQ